MGKQIGVNAVKSDSKDSMLCAIFPGNEPGMQSMYVPLLLNVNVSSLKLWFLMFTAPQSLSFLFSFQLGSTGHLRQLA